MRFLIRILLIALAAAPLQAQQCQLSDTVLQCWERYLPTAAVATTQTQQQVANANTGITNLVSPSDSALKDFLTLLSTSLESATFTEDANQAFTFDWNPNIKILGAPAALKFQAVFNNAQLSSQLTTALSSNATAIADLDETLRFESDVALSGTFNPINTRFGRSITPHSQYFQTIFFAVQPDTSAEDLALFNALKAAGVKAESQKFTDLAGDQQQTALQLVEGNAKIAAANRKTVKAFTDAFGTLLSNQSQIYASAIYAARQNIVGPNQWTAKLTYEWGPQNLTTFLKKNEDTCGADKIAANAASCANKIVDYAKNAATDRLAFSLEYDRTNRRWIDLTEFSVAYGIPRSKKLVYSLTYGRPLAPPMRGQGARLDVNVDYEDVQDSTEDDNRFVASATYTYKINDTFSFPIGIVYASHEADLPSTDEQLNAHFGLIYKMPDLQGLFGNK